MKHLFDTDQLEAAIFSAEEAEASIKPEIEEPEVLDEANPEDLPALELTLELADGRSLTYEVIGVFVHEEKEYAALHPKTDTEGEIHLMQLLPGENDEIRLLPIEDDEELNAAADAFYRLIADEDKEDDVSAAI